MGGVVDVQKCISQYGCVPNELEKQTMNTSTVEPVEDYSEDENDESSSTSSSISDIIAQPGASTTIITTTTSNDNNFIPGPGYTNTYSNTQPITPINITPIAINDQQIMYNIPDIPYNANKSGHISPPSQQQQQQYNTHTNVYNTQTTPINTDIPYFNNDNSIVNQSNSILFNSNDNILIGSQGNLMASQGSLVVPPMQSISSKHVDKSDLMNDSMVGSVRKRVSQIIANAPLISVGMSDDEEMLSDESSDMDENEKRKIIKAKKKEEKRLSKKLNTTHLAAIKSLGLSTSVTSVGTSDMETDYDDDNNNPNNNSLDTPHGRLIRDKSKAMWTNDELTKEQKEMTKQLIKMHKTIEGKEMQAQLLMLQQQNSQPKPQTNNIVVNNEYGNRIDINHNNNNDNI